MKNQLSIHSKGSVLFQKAVGLLVLLFPLIVFSQEQKTRDSIFIYGNQNSGALTEQWEGRDNGRSIRNVVSPTLIPILSDPKKATGTAVIIAPGGAFRFISIDNEGYEAAKWFAEHGIAAFILKYRTEPTPRQPKEYSIYMDSLMQGFAKEINSGNFQPQTPDAALQDVQTAVKLVRSRGAQWKINPDRIGIIGFSAGALMAVKNAISNNSEGKANFIASLYGQLVLYPVPNDAPPMFVAMASDDRLSGQGGFELISAWQKAGRSVEVHLYTKGGHAFALRKQGTTSDLWTEQLLAWMKTVGVLDVSKK